MADFKYSFSDIVNIDDLTKIFESFSKATGFTTGLVDQKKNEILIATGWRDICTKFHRENLDSLKYCKASNIELTKDLDTPGKINIYQCKSGLVDGCTPIIIEGKHLANLCTGQILFAEPDISQFKGQSKKFGYDEEAYLKSLSEVPIVTEESFREMLRFLSHMAIMVAQIGLANLRPQKDHKEIENQKVLLDSMINSIPDLIFYKDRDSVYLGCNRAFEKYAGKKEKDIVGHTDFDFFPGDVAEFFRNKDRKMIISGKVKNNEEWITYPDGRKVLLDTLKTPYIGPDKTVLGLIGISRDITNLKKTEHQLSMFKLFAESSSQGIGWTDIDGNIIYINPTMMSFIGEKKRDACIGENIVEIYYPEAEQRRLMDDILPIILKNGSWTGELVLRQRGGLLIPTQNNLFLIRDEFSGSQFLANIVIDITEKKKIEAEMLKIQKLESIGVLAGGIAHDFNNILAAILGNIEMAEMSVESSNKAYSLLQKAKKASIRAKDLTQQLLTFSKGGEPVREIASIYGIIVDSATFALHGSSVKCNFTIPEDLWNVNIDSGQMSQVIHNLILNARHAMPDGGIIDVRCENTNDVKNEGVLLAEQKYIKIIISDTGSGIPEKYLDKIFDPYFSTKQTGSGLGLAICYSIISKHDGSISVHSEINKGTNFTIFLPASFESIKKTLIKDDSHLKIKDHANIMVMDDDPMILDMVKQMLENKGHDVVLAKNGHEAVELYNNFIRRDHSIDIVIMDLTIPGSMGGKDAVKEILKIDPSANVIVSSGYSNDPVMSNYKDYGFKGSITKPFQLTELDKILSTFLK